MRNTQGRIFRVAACIVLVMLFAMGLVLQNVVKGQIRKQAFVQLENDAQVLAQLAAAYYADGAMTNMQFIINLDLVSRVSGADAVICDESGRVILCSDSPTGCVHQGLVLNQNYRNEIIREGKANHTGSLSNLYGETRHISAVPVYASATGQAVGIVIVSTPVSQISRDTSRITSSFLLSVSIVILVSAIFMAYFSRQQSNPLREMAKTARSFGHGDLDARVKLTGRHPAEIEDLALAFNNMAASLQKSEYSRQEFVANVSHELKTPMTTIGGYVDGILDGTIPPEKQEHYMRIVSQETKRLSRLVRSMLDISRLQGEGGIPAEKLSRFDMEECVGGVLITFEQKILAKNLAVDVDMPACPVYTVANQDYISQVVYNLLDNAVKFCPEGGKLSLKLREGNDKLYVSVANDGETIPPEELSLLFDRFHKLDKSRTENRDGWGLGLYIVRTIIGLHGEDISVTSSDNKTEFTFTLPLAD